MPVTREDVLHIADLARLGIDAARADALTKELSAILSHMQVLSQVETTAVSTTAGIGSAGTPLRPDVAVPGVSSAAIASIAPAMRDGFFIVPRLSTHEDSSESGA
jgi:aspartyl-tRNA(Asn)/glutamyl-tRNA(Gln) amidotransferase subunit C